MIVYTLNINIDDDDDDDDDDDNDDDNELLLCMVEQQKALSFISNRNHCQKFSPSQISETPQVGLEFSSILFFNFERRTQNPIVTLCMILFLKVIT